ncbi:hypothetical protein [Flavobacterium sp. UMI-01]|uniref:hypothetical protein n=1 Tax=Flavobacterium sp. UMI-01 TaxID=1441053 RepID=UPI002104E73C|nr:hypothetical protein [Flavobacterium sp. UMI-01]
MKLFFATLLSLLLLLPSLGSVVIYTQFKMAQDEIAQTICIQRANINNSCNGRCELQKSLKKYEDNEKRMNHTNLKEKTELVYTVAPFEFHFDPNNTPSIKEAVFSVFCEKPKSVSFAVFHPPLV